MAFPWGTAFRIAILILVVAAIVAACLTLPVDKILKDFLLWVHEELGPWGPVVLIVAYIPLTIIAVPASILTLGGGYLFGLPIGFVADSIGSTAGAGAAFILGRTIGRSYVMSKLKDHPRFLSVSIAIHRSGFKIMLLLRLAPLLPFNLTNYFLAVTPVSLGEYMLASWLGMMPITLAMVYVGTTLKDLSEVTHGWNEFSVSDWVFIILSLLTSVVLMIWVTRVAKAALEEALAGNEGYDDVVAAQQPVAETPEDLKQPLIVKVDPSEADEK